MQEKKIKINKLFSVLTFCTNLPSDINMHICTHHREGLNSYKTDDSEGGRRLTINKIMKSSHGEKNFMSYLKTLLLFEEILTILSLQNRRIKALFYFRQGLQKVEDLCQVCRRHMSGFQSRGFSHHRSCSFSCNCLLV